MIYHYDLDETKHGMQMYAYELSSKIIFAHMKKQSLDLHTLIENSPYEVTFFDTSGNLLAGVKAEDGNISQGFRLTKDKAVLVDKSTFGHLGIDAIMLQDDHFYGLIDSLQRKILLLLLLSYAVISVIGYFLAKLFMQPISMRRLQLDNFIKESTHELNTPVSALLMCVDSKKDKCDKNDERIKISARRISDIYGDLAYLLLQDEVSDKIETLDVVAMTKAQIAGVTPLADKKKITIVEDYENPLSISMDKESLIRLVNNLLNNAIKYNKAKGTIKVHLKKKTLSIEDSGIGIDKKHQEEIFKRFYRASDESGGFGLGLNIVYKICKCYDIKIDLKSSLGTGTKFSLIFS